MTVLRDTLGEVVSAMPVETAKPVQVENNVDTVRTAPETDCSALSQATTLRPFDSVSTAATAQRKACETHRRLRLFCPQMRGEQCHGSLRDVLDGISRWRMNKGVGWVERTNAPKNSPWKYVDRKLLESVVSDASIVDVFERLFVSRLNEAKQIPVPAREQNRRGVQVKFKDRVDALRKSEDSKPSTANTLRFRLEPLSCRPTRQSRKRDSYV